MSPTPRFIPRALVVLTWCVPAIVALVAISAPGAAWAQADLGATKLTELQTALRAVAITAVGIAGILAGVYIAFGRQDGNEKLGNVVKGAIIISVIVSAVSWLAS